MENWEIDKSWTLFLDRDGVINKRLPGDYVQKWSDFQFLEGVLEALSKAATTFGVIVIVTNQQGIGKGLMTETDLEVLHTQMLSVIKATNGRIDKVYICPELKDGKPKCRKPNTGMGEQAKVDFPNIDFQKSIILGDSASDIAFGQRLSMKTVWVTTKPEDFEQIKALGYDLKVESFFQFMMKVFNDEKINLVSRN